MKFRDLSKEQQEILIDNFNIVVANHAEKEGVEDYQNPTFDELADFFDDFDEEYEIKDGVPESVVETQYHKTYSIDFNKDKVILNTYDPEYNDDF